MLKKIQGMFMGAFLGDALGVPHEFRCNANIPYTGKLEHKGFHISKFQGKRELEVGQVSDDTEMSLALLRTIIKDGDYNKDNVIMAYIAWANSGTWMMGKNTRELLKNIKTIRGYRNRIQKVLNLPDKERTQSNGAMMRCSPLALFSNYKSYIFEDVSITNPNTVCIDANIVYMTALRMTLSGSEPINIFEQLKLISQTEQVKDVLAQVENGVDRDISVNKGWCLHSLWCAITVMLKFENYPDAMKWIMSKKGDTDTNACIAGAIIGARLGIENLNQEENIKILLECKSNRPKEYSFDDFYTLTEEAAKLYQE